MAERAGNIAQHLYIRDQTIHIGGAPEWIQTLPLADLQTARDRLHSAARRHEALALTVLLVPFLAAVLVIGVLSLSLLGAPEADRHQAGPALLWMGGLIAVAILFALYDVRRRHRRVVAAAERRWAELVVEIAAREDPPKREAPFKRLARWWRARRSSPVAHGGRDVA
jgi:hypothetical protein